MKFKNLFSNIFFIKYLIKACLPKYTGGELRFYDMHGKFRSNELDRFKKDLVTYLTRQIGLEAQMTIRCTRGISLHTFHGNLFLKKAEVFALPNLSPHLAFAMEVSIDEPLIDLTAVCFQTAVLYTTTTAERRLRVHTYCVPVSRSYNELINSVDQDALACLLSKIGRYIYMIFLFFLKL